MKHNPHWWKIILNLKDFAEGLNVDEEIENIRVGSDGSISLNKHDATVSDILFISFNDQIFFDNQNSHNGFAYRINELLNCIQLHNHPATEDSLPKFLELYLPYALIPYFSKKQKKTYTISHLTQSLDGKIATSYGHSKWIGNEEDLIHTHCMRSLCDAIIIGNNTIKSDEPKLTVRNVEGKNPIKIIIGNTKSNLESLLQDIDKPLISFSNKSLYKNDERIKEIILEGDYVSSNEILKHLKNMGISSLFIEGGATTVSCFLKNKNIDSFQIHIANKILGSGISVVNLGDIKTIDECISLKGTKHYHLGEEILITANI
jgi:diaminohydroxyphosphoribosylaminopyrimidine deaminase / 5-amino-6-(5-phosphoribosylamino)uracil reductase